MFTQCHELRLRRMNAPGGFALVRAHARGTGARCGRTSSREPPSFARWSPRSLRRAWAGTRAIHPFRVTRHHVARALFSGPSHCVPGAPKGPPCKGHPQWRQPVEMDCTRHTAISCAWPSIARDLRLHIHSVTPLAAPSNSRARVRTTPLQVYQVPLQVRHRKRRGTPFGRRRSRI